MSTNIPFPVYLRSESVRIVKAKCSESAPMIEYSQVEIRARFSVAGRARAAELVR